MINGIKRKRAPRHGGEPEEASALPQSVVLSAVSAVPDYCDVIDAHVRDVIDQTDGAARSIVRQMVEVDSLAEVMVGDIGRLAGLLNRTEAHLGRVSDSNDQLVERLISFILHRDQQIRELIGQMRELGQHVTRIEEANSATGSQALDAMGGSLGEGEAGKGSPAVAGEVCRREQHLAEAAHGIGNSITDLTRRLDEALSEDVSFQNGGDLIRPAGETAMTRRLDSIANAQRDVSRMASDMLRDTANAADQVRLTSDALFRKTIGAMAHVQFQDICRQMLEHISGTVADVRRQHDDLSAYARGELEGEELLKRAIQVDDLRAKHVMSRQRTTHASLTGAESETSPEPQIELF